MLVRDVRFGTRALFSASARVREARTRDEAPPSYRGAFVRDTTGFLGITMAGFFGGGGGFGASMRQRKPVE
jgi:hypothetical protein